MTDLALELLRVEYAYRRDVALRGVSLKVKPGEVVAITGPSGCGKSTLLHCAAGILRPQAGTVQLVGQDLADLSEAVRTRLRRTQAGVVLQFGQLVPDLTLIDNVALPLLLEGHDRAGARRAAKEWLDRGRGRRGRHCGAERALGWAEPAGGRGAGTRHRTGDRVRRRAHRQPGQRRR
ncbi:ATP-binding cassette domain-containing protein [Kribbella qitaiheensis]|uniref:ATP-binding cassette domain-containing protein n=1 Tax=Kribbella qitaiheensis TaxID=1544730 RepID=UPI001FEBA6D6|nr:ATP-binding cassette domain-containing protein [Kribbella qitaiheensis]